MQFCSNCMLQQAYFFGLPKPLKVGNACCSKCSSTLKAAFCKTGPWAGTDYNYRMPNHLLTLNFNRDIKILMINIGWLLLLMITKRRASKIVGWSLLLTINIGWFRGHCPLFWESTICFIRTYIYIYACTRIKHSIKVYSSEYWLCNHRYTV